MAISMDRSVRYVTQASVWGTCFRGRLTDRKIKAYQKAGYYGRVLPPALRPKRKLSAKTVLQTLLGEYS